MFITTSATLMAIAIDYYDTTRMIKTILSILFLPTCFIHICTTPKIILQLHIKLKYLYLLEYTSTVG